MKIQKIEYENIYGSLSGKLEFSRGENFLVGINGCGKTTILNIIRWVLEPYFPELCTLQHDLIKIDIKHNKYLYSIQSRILKEKHQLKVVTRDKSRDFKPIDTTLTIAPSHIRGSVDDLKRHYEHMAPEPHEVSTWNFLAEELPAPVFIGLKRSIEDRPPSQIISKIQEGMILSREGHNISPHTKATTLMRDAFNTSRRKLVEINDDLNQKVMELSFSGVIHRKLSSHTKSSTQATSKKIRQLKARFEDSSNKEAYSKTLSSSKVREAVVRYLDELASILKREKKEDEVWIMLNQHNFDRAAKMFDLFEQHESKVKDVQLEINNFAKAVNNFIGDSKKSIHFDEDTGEPFFTSNSNSKKLRISELSSGEAQIVILLSYFAFLAKRGIPIVIDEPELSLHVQWQKHFVSAVKKVMPDGCQTIMATHSPEICGAEDVNVQSILVRGVQ